MSTTLSKYPGNKSVKGLYQFIINHIPAHSVYYEPFAGSAVIARLLPPVVPKYINDCNGSVVRELVNLQLAGTTVTHGCGILQLETSVPAERSVFVYCDPPYLFATRRSQIPLYKYEFSEADHVRFLSKARTANFNCMISAYEHTLYDEMLSGWNKAVFPVSVHGIVRLECIYYNYPKPSVLQCYDYVGSDCWDRQRVKRKIDRLTKKLLELPEIERNAIISRINTAMTVPAMVQGISVNS